MAFFSCGLLFLLIFGQSATLRCDRLEPRQVVCEREKHWLGVVRTSLKPVEGLTEARITESCDDSCAYEVELLTAGGDVGLTGYYTSGYRDKQAVVDEINGFLADPAAPSLEVTSDAGLLGVLFPLFFMLIGMGAVGVALFGSLRWLGLFLR